MFRSLWLGAALVPIFLAALWIAFFVLPQRMVSGRGLTKEQRLKAQSDIRTTGVQALGGLIVLLGAGVGAYFTQRQLQHNIEGQVTERFTRAIDQLAGDKPEVRLGGIYALERIARGSRVDHGPILEVLTAYVREHSPWPPSEPGQPVADMPSSSLGVLRDRDAVLQAVLTVLGRRNRTHEESYQGTPVDSPFFDLLRGRLDLSFVDLRRANFVGAHFEGANFLASHLEAADASGAHLEGAIFSGAHLEGTIFGGAHLEDSVLPGAHLEGASLVSAFAKGANLAGAHLQRAVCGIAHLADLEHPAHFEGTTFGGAHLEGAIFGGAHLECTFLGLSRDTRKTGHNRGAIKNRGTKC
jgi:hypothetical protein